MGLLSGITSSVGKVLNSITGVSSSQDKTYDQQMRAMNAQNAYNTQMWNLQNEYNSPSSQLARMREAGIDINPTSYALGTSNLSNTASLVGSADGFAGHGSPAGNPISQLMGLAQGIQGINESKARAQLDVANAGNMQANTKRIGVENNNTRERTRQIANDNAFFEEHGYYPPHGETPALSSFDTGPVKQVVDDAWDIFKTAHTKARNRYIKEHPEYNGW